MVVGALLGGSLAVVAIGIGVLIWHLASQREPVAEPSAVVQLPPEIGMTVRALLGRRQKIQAIKLVRDSYPGMSLRDAKDLVDGIQDEVPYAPAPQRPGVRVNGNAVPTHADLAARARQLKLAGHEVQAVRLVRDETGMNLTEAMAFVQALT
jgi:ribosomal protein L7/L12